MRKLLFIISMFAITVNIAAQQIKYSSQIEYSDGLALVSKNGLYGFIDKKGHEIIPLIYGNANSFSEGLAAVFSNKFQLWGFVDKTGEVVIDFKYKSVGQPYELPYKNFQGGYVAVEIKGEKQHSSKIGLIDTKGNIVIPFSTEYSYIYKFADGMAKVQNYTQKSGFVNEAGELTVPMIYDQDLISNFSEGLASFKTVTIDKKGNKDFKTGFIDKNGKVLFPANYDWANDFSEGLAKVSKNGNVFFIDKTGKVALKTVHNLATSGFTDGLCAVIKGKKGKEKYGFINKSGILVIPYIYDKVTGFNNGVSSVQKNGLYGIINTSNQVIYPFELYYLSGFYDGMAKYKYRSSDKNHGFINHQGEKVTLCIYDGMYDFEDGKVRVRKKDGTWITIGKNGLQN